MSYATKSIVPAVKKIRIILANRPQLARDVVRGIIDRQGDMEVVREAEQRFDLLLAVKETHADAVILSAHDSDVQGLCSHLLAEYPGLTILALSVEGRSAFVEQLCPSRREIADPSNERVLAALRQAIRDPCDWIREADRGASPGFL